MAFANLFAKLSAVDGDEGALTHSGTDGDQKDANKKRKPRDNQSDPHNKKRCWQAQTTGTYNVPFQYDDSKAKPYHSHNTDREYASVNFSMEVMHNRSSRAGHNDMYHQGNSYTAKNTCAVKKQQQQKKKTEWQKNQQQLKNTRKHTNRSGHHHARPTSRKGGGHSKRKGGKEDIQVKPTRFMTQEFKDQNALLVDGRLLCRHFLFGRCIKGDGCQLEHIQGYNDLIKVVCKFYVQGLCTKGENCPYMHKSFPCKFFHRNGKCSQGADCKFSHEPLNEVTKQLLEEVLKRDSDLYELAKKAEQEASGQQVNADKSEVMEISSTPDILLHPVRPNFYNTGETNAEQEALCRTEKLSGIMEEVFPPHTLDTAKPLSSPSTKPNHEEPVCYSVEAVLGSQLFKPFPSFYSTPESQESTPLSVAQPPDSTSDRSEAPYSVGAILRSCKSVENFTSGHTPTPPTAHIITYTPVADCEEVTEPPLKSETQNKKVLYSVCNRNEETNSKEKIFSSLPSLQMHAERITATHPGSTLASGEQKKQGGETKDSQKSTQKVKLHSLSAVLEKSVISKSQGGMKGSTHLLTCSVTGRSERVLTGCSGHPTQLKSHLSALTSNSQASINPLCPSGFSEFKDRCEPTNGTDSGKSIHQIYQHSKMTQSVIEPGTQQYSTEATSEYSSRSAHRSDLSMGCNKTQKRPFYSLFASPITGSLRSTPDPDYSQGLGQFTCSTPQSAHCTSKDIRVETADEPEKTTDGSFLSLFATPLRAPLPCTESQLDYSRTSSSSQESDHSLVNTGHLSPSKQRASNSETALSLQVKTDVRQSSHWPSPHNISPRPKNECKDGSSELENQLTEQLVNPVCSLESESLCEISSSPAPCCNRPDSSTTQAQQQPPNISSHKGSVLKTLFLCLSPFQQDGVQQGSMQISVPPAENDMDISSTGYVSVKKKRKPRKKR
ncbi:uncharacterized protein LOC113128549 isoform X2 [Mastacembelus armatus]|uniref:Uncharacterized LOC113128549 n=1 Tax=Mastacembelus armatus TaxID=205130 RepID=A0A3Q3RR57_9TELE|nr:uncharacterized protein LOC113128549 isoform X2 [Mastacembelus armatus]XP_026159749.1 uncharacterized protein LOC113128549 isoform X2 [Mastacembelus armatus]